MESVVVQVRSRLVGGILFEYLPGTRTVRIVRRGIVFEVSVDELAGVDTGDTVLMLRPCVRAPDQAPVETRNADSVHANNR